MKEYSLEELKQFNGKQGSRAYISYNGLVYDVTDSFLWKDGKHQASHCAGEDLTDALIAAPHGVEFVNKFPVIGYLKRK